MIARSQRDLNCLRKRNDFIARASAALTPFFGRCHEAARLHDEGGEAK